MYYIGIDQHKKYSYVVVKDQNGNRIDQTKLYHFQKDAMKNYFKALPHNSSVALEASGFDLWLGDLLEEAGLDVSLAHTARTKAIAEQRIKTDKISASVLADLLRADLLPKAYRVSRFHRDARALMRYRHRLIAIRTSLKNRIHAILDYQGIQHSFSDLFGVSGKLFLNQLSLRQPYSSMIADYLSFIDILSRHIYKIDSRLRLNIKVDSKARLLYTVPGIGVILAHVILAEIGDISRFKNAHKLARYAGIVPRVHQSGQSYYSGPITKDGNKYLRTAFVEAAQTAVRRDIYLQTHFQKIRTKKGYGVAIVAVAHKLLKSVFAVLKNNCEYKYRSV